MSSNSPGPSQSGSSPSTPDFSALPRGLLGRKGLPVARGARLPSLRTPRDLTLGGATKRTFTPNIPARREKKDDDVKNASGIESASNRGRGSRRSQSFTPGERGRGRGRGSNLVQLQGAVFGEGIASEAGKRRGAFGQSSSHEGSSSSSKTAGPLPKYTPNFKGQTKAEKEYEEAKLHELRRDDFIDFEDEISQLNPVQLPLLVAEVKKEVDVQPDVKPVKTIKPEPLSDEEAEPMDVDGQVKIKVEEVKSEIKQENDCSFESSSSTAKLFTNANIPESGKLLFFQFPDCLPGASGKSNEDPRMQKEPGPSKSGDTSSQSQTAEDKTSCVLSDLPEGFIGKLQVLKSGRTRLLLGSISLNVELGMPLGFLQDLVSVRINEDRDPPSGDMFVLGHVQDKLVCLPDMDSLLKDLKKL